MVVGKVINGVPMLHFTKSKCWVPLHMLKEITDVRQVNSVF